MRFMQLGKEHRRLTFYSEGKNYWPHLSDLVMDWLENSNQPICFFTSDPNDPALQVKHRNFHAFEIDEGFIRNWLFENIETDVMVMTMPDLHQFQVKRSKNQVHYIYLQHSLVSLHMAYRKGAFDFFDTIFCAGPHHVKEIRAIEAYYDLAPKSLVNYGYPRLNSIIQADNTRTKPRTNNSVTHVLVAPSWGEESTIESGRGEAIVDDLLSNNYMVTLRPHPQTLKFASKQISKIVSKHGDNPMFVLEKNVDGQESLHSSNFMISDWSGAALDYAFGLQKPVAFVDVPRKVNNLDYEAIGIEPFEVKMRETIGAVMKDDKFSKEELESVKILGDSEQHYFPASSRLGIEAINAILELKDD